MFRIFALSMTIICAAVVGMALYGNKKRTGGLFVTDAKTDDTPEQIEGENGIKTIKWFWNAVSGLLDKYWYIILALIFIVYLITRLFRLNLLPMGIHVDELGAATDAKMIRDFGTDRYGVRYPFYFQNYGGGQSAMYLYMVSILIRFLPCTIFTLRLPAVICGALCLFAMFGICYELSGSRKWGLVGAILVTVLPVYIMSERWALDAFLMLPISTCFMYFAIRAVKYEKQRDWIITGVIMGLTLYTYATSHFTLPIMVVLTGIYLIIIKKFKWKQVLSLGVPLVILAFPLIIYNLVDLGFIKPFSFWFTDFVPQSVERETMLSISNIPDNLAFFVKVFTGEGDLSYNVLPEFGTIYLFLIIFLIIGMVFFITDFVRSFKEKRFSIGALLLFYDFGLWIFLMLVKGANVNRANGLFMSFSIYIFWGIYKTIANRPVSLTITGVITAASFAFFMFFYLFMQDDVYGYHDLFSTSGPMEAVSFIKDNYLKDGGKIYMMIEDEAFYPDEMLYYAAAPEGQKFEWDATEFGDVVRGFPEEFDENENAVYMIGDNWSHISSYIISVGFNQDYRYPGYVVLYK